MAKKFFEKLSPNHKRVKENKYLKLFGNKINHIKLWNPTRETVARAFGIGIFIGLLPLPFQMIIVILLAIIIRANISISLALVWITNPLTMPIIYYVEYLTGSFILDTKLKTVELNLEWFEDNFMDIFYALYIGGFFISIVLSVLSYFLIHRIWIFTVKYKRNKAFKL